MKQTIKHNTAQWYGTTSPPLRAKLAHDTKKCKAEVTRNFGAEVELARRLLDTSYEVACHYMWCFKAPHIVRQPDKATVLIAAFHKGIFTLSSCLDLTCQGLYGPARPLLRHAFEFLVIAKFCSVSTNTHIYEKWLNGDVVYFANGILKKINSPDVTPIAELWGELNELTHATSSSSQIGLHFPTIAQDIQINLSLIRVLCDWLAHLLTRHVITPSMRYATKRHRPEGPKLQLAQECLAELRSISRSAHAKDSKRLITCYRSKWSTAT